MLKTASQIADEVLEKLAFGLARGAGSAIGKLLQRKGIPAAVAKAAPEVSGLQGATQRMRWGAGLQPQGQMGKGLMGMGPKTPDIGMQTSKLMPLS
jgi:hypothetical protein